MEKLKFICISFILITCFSNCGTNLKIPIDKGKINGNFTITLPGRNVTIKNNEFFRLSDLGLSANSGQVKKKTILATDIKSALKLFKKQKIKNYDIRISKDGFDRPYYGKIAFFNTTKIH